MPDRRFVLFGGSAAVVLSPLPAVAAETRSGRFAGASGHRTTGGVDLVIDGAQSVVRLHRDFSFDGAPDPKVALGRDGFDRSGILAPLARDSGAQTYRVPDRMDLSGINQVWIWCEQYAVPLGLATLG